MFTLKKLKNKWKATNTDDNITQARFSIDILKSRKTEEEIMKPLENMFQGFSFINEQLKLNSQNSNYPSSQDGNGNKNDKKDDKGKRPAGGQVGHPGRTLNPVENPNRVVVIAKPDYLEGVKCKIVGQEKRQVIDIKIETEVTEYQADIYELADGTRVTGEFPSGVTEKVQYGSSVKAAAVELSQKGMLSMDRASKFFRERGIGPANSSIANWLEEANHLLLVFVLSMRRVILNCTVINVDETGIRIDGENYWCHVYSTVKWVLLYIRKKRGSLAIDDINLIPRFLGTLVHDGFKAYFKYQCKHGLCNAHHLRELAWCADHTLKWAVEMTKHLLIMRDRAIKQVELSDQECLQLMGEYDRIVKKGKAETSKIGNEIARRKSTNFLKRLERYSEETTRFLKEKDVPFTNNLAERDIRMTKVKQKIGMFRSLNGAKYYARIRSYILTCERNGITAHEALVALFEGRLSEILERIGVIKAE